MEPIQNEEIQFKHPDYSPCKNPDFQYNMTQVLKTTFYNQNQPFPSCPGKPHLTYYPDSYFEDMILRLDKKIHDRSASPSPVLLHYKLKPIISDFYGPFKGVGQSCPQETFHFVQINENGTQIDGWAMILSKKFYAIYEMENGVRNGVYRKVEARRATQALYKDGKKIKITHKWVYCKKSDSFILKN